MASRVQRKKYIASESPSKSPIKLIPAFSQTHTHFQISSTPAFTPPTPHHSHRRLKLVLGRLKLQWVTGLLAGSSLAMSIGSYWVEDWKSPSVTVVLCVCSLVQVWLILSYWVIEGKTTLLTSRAVGTVNSGNSSSRRIWCGLECLLHLIIPMPVDFLVSGIRANFVAYLILLSRNYHFFRLLYWISPYSSLHAHIYSSFLNVGCLTYKHYLRRWSAVCAGFAILSLWLLLIATLGQEAANTGLKALFRLGESQPSPSNPKEQVAAVVSACIGVYLLFLVLSAVRKATTLTEKEALLSAQLCAQQTSLELRTKAAELLQAWWRLLHMRHRHRLSLSTVFTWYRTLFTFLRLKPHTNARIGYCFFSHFAAMEREVKARIKRVQVLARINARLEAILRKETVIVEKANYLAGRRTHISLPSRLSTIKEAVNESSPSVNSPDINCYFPLPLHLIGS